MGSDVRGYPSRSQGTEISLCPPRLILSKFGCLRGTEKREILPWEFYNPEQELCSLLMGGAGQEQQGWTFLLCGALILGSFGVRQRRCGVGAIPLENLTLG